jgi:hypothetical protein
MNANALHQPLWARAQSARQKPLLLSVSTCGNGNPLLGLEQDIANPGQRYPQEQWLNDYLDLGLEEAAHAGNRGLKPLQESWLIRLYATLRSAAVSPAAPQSWRQLCFDYLYQPFFALQDMYQQSPVNRTKLYSLRREFAALERLLQR